MKKRKFNILGLIFALLGVGGFRLAHYIFHNTNIYFGMFLAGMSLVFVVFGGFTLFIKKNQKEVKQDAVKKNKKG